MHHARKPKESCERPTINVISTSSWLEQVPEGETKAAKSFRERQRPSEPRRVGSSRLVSNQSRFKNGWRRSVLSEVVAASEPVAASKTVGYSLSQRQPNARQQSSSTRVTGGCCRQNPPEYDVDEEETDGYIYWHASTRRCSAGLFAIPTECWWLNLSSWDVNSRNRRHHLPQQWTNWKRLRRMVCNCCDHSVCIRCAVVLTIQRTGLRDAQCPPLLLRRWPLLTAPRLIKYPARVLLAFSNPSLNDLELAGLICQLATLLCGLGCLVWSEVDPINGDIMTKQSTFVLGAASMCTVLLFVAVVLIFWYNAIRRRAQSTKVLRSRQC